MRKYGHSPPLVILLLYTLIYCWWLDYYWWLNQVPTVAITYYSSHTLAPTVPPQLSSCTSTPLPMHPPHHSGIPWHHDTPLPARLSTQLPTSSTTPSSNCRATWRRRVGSMNTSGTRSETHYGTLYVGHPMPRDGWGMTRSVGEELCWDDAYWRGGDVRVHLNGGVDAWEDNCGGVVGAERAEAWEE